MLMQPFLEARIKPRNPHNVPIEDSGQTLQLVLYAVTAAVHRLAAAGSQHCNASGPNWPL
jgi:hypothetical protein